MPPARVLVLDEEIPYPPDTGKKIRTLNLLSSLAGEFQIDFLAHDTAPAVRHAGELRRRGIELHVAPSRVPEKSGLLFPLRLARNLLFSARPFSVDAHDRAGYRTLFRRLQRERGYGLVHCEWSPYAAYLGPDDRNAVIAAHNVESQIWKRMAETDAHPLRRAFIALQARRMLRFERGVFRAAHFATAVSEEDAATLRAMGCPRVDVVPNGVDLDYFRLGEGAADEPRTIAFTGSMDWRPNQDAIRWFVEAIHPLLVRRGPYRLFVVGRNPPAWLAGEGAVPAEITVTGTVDDVRPYIERAAAYVVPLRIGGGSRLKILEALAMRRAVVSTTVGAEGLEIEDGRHYLRRDAPEAIVEALETLFTDAERRRALGDAGRAVVEQRYSWSGIAAIQARLWTEALA